MFVFILFVAVLTFIFEDSGRIDKRRSKVCRKKHVEKVHHMVEEFNKEEEDILEFSSDVQHLKSQFSKLKYWLLTRIGGAGRQYTVAKKLTKFRNFIYKLFGNLFQWCEFGEKN